MFEELTRKLDGILRRVKGHGKLTEKNIADSLREVRRALLEADVHYKVAKDFIAAVQQKAVGQEVLRSVTPGQQVVKIIYDELTRLMGQTHTPIRFASIPPTVIMLVGLQGSGKTTLAGKLARYLGERQKSSLLVACDIRRPAAMEQLKVIGDQVGYPVYAEADGDPVALCENAVHFARKNGFDVVILDTAGRLHVDTELMEELKRIRERVKPHEILFVADGMTGQDAVKAAQTFLEYLDFDGVVLTKLDGDARGGAALSIRAVTGKPIKFISVGEKLDALELFHPDRMASRILGMGDVVSLVEKAQEAADLEKVAQLERKLRTQEFTLEDFYDQLQQLKRMGPLDQLVSMIPGLGASAMTGLEVDERELVRMEAIINSMTREERQKPQIINASRKRRIARGSGTTIQDVNRLLRHFFEMQKLFRRLSKWGKRGPKRGMFPLFT